MGTIMIHYLLVIGGILLVGLSASQGIHPDEATRDALSKETFKCHDSREISVPENDVAHATSTPVFTSASTNDTYYETSTKNFKATCDETTTSPDQDLYVQYVFTFPGAACIQNEKTYRIYIGSVKSSSSSGSRCSSIVRVKVSFPLMPNITDIEFDLSHEAAPGSEGKIFTLQDEFVITETGGMLDTDGEVTNSTVVVAASAGVVAYGFHGCSSSQRNMAAAFRVRQIDSLGNDYWVSSHHSTKRPSVVAIAALDDATIVSLNPVRVGSPVNVTLSRYESFMWPLERDFLGVHVTTNHVVTLLVGHDRTIIPVGSKNYEPFMECLDPVTNWGRIYALFHLLDPTLSGGNTVRVLAAINATVTWTRRSTLGINEDNQTLPGIREEWKTDLKAGEYFETEIPANSSDPLEVLSDVRLFVVQFTHKNDHSSPSMVQVPALDHPLVNNTAVVFPVFDLTAKMNGTYYLTVYVPSEAKTSDLYLNDVNNLDWQTIGKVSSDWRILQTTLPAGSHVLEVKGNYSINAIVFAHEFLRSYAYSIA